MYFTNNERRILCFLKVDEGLSYQVAERFRTMFPARPKPSPIGVKKMLDKLRVTSIVADRHKSGRPRTATNESNEVLVLGSVELNMQQSVRELTFHRNGVVNRHNCRHWLPVNPDAKTEPHSQSK